MLEIKIEMGIALALVFWAVLSENSSELLFSELGQLGRSRIEILDFETINLNKFSQCYSSILSQLRGDLLDVDDFYWKLRIQSDSSSSVSLLLRRRTFVCLFAQKFLVTKSRSNQNSEINYFCSLLAKTLAAICEQFRTNRWQSAHKMHQGKPSRGSRTSRALSGTSGQFVQVVQHCRIDSHLKHLSIWASEEVGQQFRRLCQMLLAKWPVCTALKA